MNTRSPLNHLLGLSGYARSGKDTVAKILVENYGFTRVAFADKLREALYRLNPIVTTSELGDWAWLADLVDEIGWEQAKLASPEARTYPQRLGTDVGREMFGQDFWVDQALKDLDPDGHYVVTDVRFPNEADYIRSLGGSLVRVSRPSVGPANEHISEIALDDYQFDLYLPNDGSLADLEEDVSVLVGVAL